MTTDVMCITKHLLSGLKTPELWGDDQYQKKISLSVVKNL